MIIYKYQRFATNNGSNAYKYWRNHPSKHCQPTKTTAVQFAIWQNQIMDGTNIRTTMHNRNGFHVHRTS